MANPFVPNVPNVPGVPALNRVGQVASAGLLLASDVAGIIGLFADPEWGVFDADGQPVIVGDAVLGVDFTNESKVPDYAIESGGFASYNKVATPFDVYVEIAKGGTSDDRQQFLLTAQAVLSTLTLYQVFTPEIAYPSVNLVRYSYRRQVNHGAYMIVLELYLKQIRPAPTPEFSTSNTKTPAGSPQQNDGTVEATATPTTDKLVNTVVF